MASDKKPFDSGTAHSAAPRNTPTPDWADGLRQLYDSVVEEPLPDAFKDLLEKLDGADTGSGATDRNDAS